MARWKKVACALVLLVVLAGVGTAWMFQNEIQAVFYYLQYSSEEREALKQANEEKMAAALEQANLSKAQIDSMQNEDMLSDREQTGQNQTTSVDAEQSTVQSAKKPSASKAEVVQKETEKETQKETLEDREYDAELAAMVGEIYALRTSFVGQLDDLLSQAKAEYVAIPSEERESKKMKLASKYINLAGGLEKSCDNQMEEILGRIHAHLKETNGDTSLIDEIRQVYKDEKALKKSYYLSLLD